MATGNIMNIQIVSRKTIPRIRVVVKYLFRKRINYYGEMISRTACAESIYPIAPKIRFVRRI